jgi:hypothetical protein
MHREVVSTKPPGLVFNGMVLVAFVLGLFCCSMPGLQVMLQRNIVIVLLAPLCFLVFIHLANLLIVFGGLAFLIGWLNALGTGSLSTTNTASLITHVTAIFLPCMLLWLALIWIWILRAVDVKQLSIWQWQRFNWWFAPMMLWILSILWATHIPLSVNFAFHKVGFEKLADLVIAEPSRKIDFTPNKPMGIFSMSGALQHSQTIASIETTSQHGLWAHEGFVRDLSRKPGGLKANTYSLAPGSNNGDQDIFYLSDGWYVFQNLMD